MHNQLNLLTWSPGIRNFLYKKMKNFHGRLVLIRISRLQKFFRSKLFWRQLVEWTRSVASSIQPRSPTASAACSTSNARMPATDSVRPRSNSATHTASPADSIQPTWRRKGAIFGPFSGSRVSGTPAVLSWLKWRGRGYLWSKLGRAVPRERFPQGSPVFPALLLRAVRRCVPTGVSAR